MRRNVTGMQALSKFPVRVQKSIFMVALISATGILPNLSHAQNATVTDDAQTSTTTPATPNGAGQVLRVRPGTDRVFVKFSLGNGLSLLPPGTVGAHVGRATLKVFVNAVGANGQLGVAQVAGPWTETTITNTNAPLLAATPIGFFNINAAQQNHWLTLDVTPLVQQWIDNPGSNNGVAFFAAPGGADVSIDSKEDISLFGLALTSGHQAQLEIVLNHAATADNAANAVNATQLGGVPGGNFVLKSDPVLIAPRLPLPGSSSYIQNTTVPQPAANFNISGNGTLGGALSAATVNAGLPSPLFDPQIKFNVHGTSLTEAKIRSDADRAILSLDSTIGGQHSDYTVENGLFGHAGLFGVFDRNAYLAGAGEGAERFTIDPTGKVNVTGHLDVGIATAAEPFPDSSVKLRVHSAGPTFDGISELKIQSDEQKAILSLDSTLAGKRQVWTLENGVFDIPGLFAVFDRSAGQSRFTIDTSGLVSIPGNLNVAQTLSVNTLSANILDANTQFNLGGQPILRSLPAFQSLFVGPSAALPNGPSFFNSFFGTTAGAANTTGFGDSFFGSAAGQSNTTGFENSFFGNAAGELSTDAIANSLFGYHAGFNNQGSFNSFFGREAGSANTAGHDNTFFGDQAGFANTTGIENTYFGDAAGFSTTTAGQNSFFGRSAGQQNTVGFIDTFVGYSAGLSNTTGDRNTFVGNQAGSSNLGGARNSFLGSGAGFANTSGDEDSFYGRLSGGNNKTGNRNAFFGNDAGPTNITGSSNTLVGAGTDVGADALTNATAIGAGAIVSQSNAVVLGNNANVGIGTSTPGSKLTVAGLMETTAGGVKFPDGSIQTSAANSGNVVKTLNGLFNNVTLAAGSPNVTITQAGNAIAIAAHADGTAILNQAILQAGANFDIDGTGAANILNAATEYDLAGVRVLSAPAGSNSLFAGFKAGAATSPFASGNAFFGFNAGAGNLLGSFNSFFGISAGLNSVNGGENSFFGGAAGQSSAGDRNSFFGFNSGPKNNANDNAFFGWDAGRQNSTGTENSFFGLSAGDLNDTGSNNAFYGSLAGEFNKDGGNNTFVGTNSGRANTSQSNNTFIGSNAGVLGGSPPCCNNATAIGANAVVLQDNSLVLGSINGLNGATADTSVGIGTAKPTSRLTVAGVIETTNGGVRFPDGSVQTTAATGGAPGLAVTTLNGLTGDVTLAPGSPNVTVSQAGNTISIATTPGNGAILNQTVQQAGANFNIAGNGTVFGLFATFAAAGDYREAGGDTSILNDAGGVLRVGPDAGIGSTGAFSTFVGVNTGANSGAASEDSFFGYNAGSFTTPSNGGNSYFGAFSGQNNRGDNNSFFGSHTGATNATGSNNTLLGAGSDVAVAGLTFATAVGSGAVVDASDKIVIGRPTDIVSIPGTLTKGAGSFKIDHPLDPANKTLSHSFVESPDMMNVYNGNITTDEHGDAVVPMPDWFEALNRDFRYQLTVIGQFAQAIVGSEMKNNRFSIKTDKPHVKVSWQVTGIRQDAYANAHRIPVEEEKPLAQRGSYLFPDGFRSPEVAKLKH